MKWGMNIGALLKLSEKQNNALGGYGKRCLRPRRWGSPHGAIVPDNVHENYEFHQVFSRAVSCYIFNEQL
jgi:hypothetical protein